jgi:hypothetical protein
MYPLYNNKKNKINRNKITIENVNSKQYLTGSADSPISNLVLFNFTMWLYETLSIDCVLSEKQYMGDQKMNKNGVFLLEQVRVASLWTKHADL